MTFRYSLIEREARRLYRKWRPVPRSPWTAGPVKDICAVNLVPPERLVDFFEDCISTLGAIKGTDIGDYLEFGVFNGNSIGSMYLARNNMHARTMRLFGFDAFEGLPAGAEEEDGGVWKKGFYSCSFEQMKSCLQRRDVNPNNIIWVNGWYEKTLTPETAAQHDLGNLGIVFVDCDVYSSAKAVLDFITPFITQPFIICFDDWKLNDLDLAGGGEYAAFNEFLEANPQFVAKSMRSYNRKSRTFLVRPR